MTQNQTDMTAEELAERFSKEFYQKTGQVMASHYILDWLNQANKEHKQVISKLEVERDALRLAWTDWRAKLEEAKAKIQELEAQNALLVEGLRCLKLECEATQPDENDLYRTLEHWDIYKRIVDAIKLTNTTQQAQARDKRIREAGFNEGVEDVVKIINYHTSTDPEWGFETDIEEVLKDIESIKKEGI